MTGPTPMLEGKTVLIAGVGKGLGREIGGGGDPRRCEGGARRTHRRGRRGGRRTPGSLGRATLAHRLDVTDRTRAPTLLRLQVRSSVTSTCS